MSTILRFYFDKIVLLMKKLWWYFLRYYDILWIVFFIKDIIYFVWFVSTQNIHVLKSIFSETGYLFERQCSKDTWHRAFDRYTIHDVIWCCNCCQVENLSSRRYMGNVAATFIVRSQRYVSIGVRTTYRFL